MSLLIPRINSKNRKEALRAFRVACKDDEALDAFLRRDDIVIRDEIFAYVKGWRYQLYRRVITDPMHPYHAEANRVEAGERAQKEREKEAARAERMQTILQLKGDRGKIRALKDAIDAFTKAYQLTDAEKCTLADCIWQIVDEWRIMDPDKRRKTLAEMLQPYFCVSVVKAHLFSGVAFPKEMVIQAADELGLDDDRRRSLYLWQKIADGRLVTPCEIGEHDLEFVKEITEENWEDQNLPLRYRIFRCKVCGKEFRK